MGVACNAAANTREVRRGEARHATAAANLPHREGSRRSCAGTEPRRACNPHPRALTPTTPSPWMGTAPRISPFPLLCPPLPAPALAHAREAASPCSASRKSAYSRWEKRCLLLNFKACCEDRLNIRAAVGAKRGTWGLQPSPGGLQPSPGHPLLRAAVTCCDHVLQPCSKAQRFF